MKSIRFIACIVMLSLILSCHHNSSAPDISENKAVYKSQEVMDVTVSSENASVDKTQFYNVDSAGTPAPDQEQEPERQKDKKQPAQQQAKPDWDKKIIKTAMLNAEVSSYDSFYNALREKVRSVGGYVADEAQSQSEYKIENTIVVKVPVDQFDNALMLLMAGTKKINDKRITSQDVTTEVVDTRSRMEAKKQVRGRYMDLLNQAKNMSEILSVQSEINGIQEEIEAAAGRIQYLGHSSSYSTINFTYYQVLNAIAKDKVDERPGFSDKLGNAFKTGWEFIGDVVVGLITIWPLWLLVFAIIVIYKKTKVKTAVEVKK